MIFDHYYLFFFHIFYDASDSDLQFTLGIGIEVAQQMKYRDDWKYFIKMQL